MVPQKLNAVPSTSAVRTPTLLDPFEVAAPDVAFAFDPSDFGGHDALLASLEDGWGDTDRAVVDDWVEALESGIRARAVAR